MVIATMKIYNFPNGYASIEELHNNKRHISVHVDDNSYVQRNECVTSYPIDLIEKILELKNLHFLCDEIMRDEDPQLVQKDLFFSLMSYVDPDEINGKKILDFGCGLGASSMILSRMFPKASITGVELDPKALSIAHKRLEFYQYPNIEFYTSPSGTELPGEIGDFDFILLSGVYEHLLPNERESLVPQLWAHLKKPGILFINQTPDKHFPIETHTTGLPLINYLPDGMAFFLSRHFSNRIKNESWISLLRKGIRGATKKEILDIFMRHSAGSLPMLLNPSRLGVTRQSEIWYRAAMGRLSAKHTGARKYLILLLIHGIRKAKIPFAPYLSLALEK